MINMFSGYHAIRLLKDNKKYSPFVSSFANKETFPYYEDIRNVKDLKQFICENVMSHSFIDLAFRWSATEQGYSYWAHAANAMEIYADFLKLKNRPVLYKTIDEL